MNDDDTEIEYSPLCQQVTRDSLTVRVQIYRSELAARVGPLRSLTTKMPQRFGTIFLLPIATLWQNFLKHSKQRVSKRF